MSKPQLKLSYDNLNNLIDLNITLKAASRELSKALVKEAFNQSMQTQTKGNQTQAALMLGMNRGVFKKILDEPKNDKVPLLLDGQNIEDIVKNGKINIHSYILEGFKSQYIGNALIKCRGNQTKAALQVECTRNTIRKYAAKKGI